MVSSEPNSIKEEAISKSQFYYTATCLTLLKVLPFVGIGTVGGDLQPPWAHEYSMAVFADAHSQDFGVTDFTRCSCLSSCSDFHQGFVPWQCQLVGAGVDNYCLIKKRWRQTQPTLPTALQLNQCSLKVTSELPVLFCWIWTLLEHFTISVLKFSAHFCCIKLTQISATLALWLCGCQTVVCF